VVAEKINADDGNLDLWVYDLERHSVGRLTSTAAPDSRPVWSADGTRVAFSSKRAEVFDVYVKRVDSTDPERPLITSPGDKLVEHWSADGKYMSATVLRSGLWVYPLDASGKPWMVRASQTVENWQSEFSPDGKWLAYVSNESGRDEVYVRPYPGLAPRTQITKDGGTQPAWSRTGRELFYTDYVPALAEAGGHASFSVLTVPVTLTPAFSAGPPRMLFKGPYTGSAVTRGYDVTSDGQRFILAQQLERPPTKATQISLVQNWTEELKARVPAK
jgi:Tol biopolymer transport system component